MAFWEAAFNGSSGGQVRLRVQADVISQEINNNRSLVRYNAWIERVGSTSAWSNFTTYGNTNINGYNPGRSLASYDFATTARYNIAVNEDYWVNHDANGNASPYFGANWDLANSPIITTSKTGGHFTLPNIPRYADITSWGLNGITEKSINVFVNTNRTADLVDYSLNGGGWTRGYTGAFTSRTFTIANLNPATAYSVKIRVRAQASGLYTTSGLKSATTNAVTITTLTVPSATDTTLDIAATTSHVADQIQYRVQGAASWVTSSGDFTSKQVTLTGLTANQTYTVEARARHKDSGKYTPIKTASGTTEYPQPLQPTGLTPSNGAGVGTLEPTLSWDYNATSTDFQSAYQVIVRRESDAVVMWDSGKVSSGTTDAIVPATALLAYNVNYQWQVRSWSGTDLQGPYSELTIFKTSQAPVVTITSPTAGQVSTTDAPTITWTYSDPEGTAQRDFKVEIRSIATSGSTDGDTVYIYSQSGNETTHTVPINKLNNGGLYVAIVTATDGHGVNGESAPVEFSVEFVGPPMPSVGVELSEDMLFNKITVSSTNPDNDAYETDYIRVHKREVGAIDWTSLGQITVNTTYLDQMASATGWVGSGTAGTVTVNELSRQGSESLSFSTTAAGAALFDKTSTTKVISADSTMRVWVYPVDLTTLTSLMFKVGADATNYYYHTVLPSQLVQQVWNSIEVPVSQLVAVGSPSYDSINTMQIRVEATAIIPSGNLLIDGWRLTPDTNSLFLYDYNLANHKSYEYTASAVNTAENLEGAYSNPTAPVAIKYGQFLNTYIIPVYAQTNSVIAFMDTKDLPNWVTQTDTEYHMPIGAKYPVVYTSGTQKFRTGEMTVRFDDKCFDGQGIEGVHQFESIMNEKPLMVRTYWGEMYHVSINGSLQTVRIKDTGWSVTFSFTEIGW